MCKKTMCSLASLIIQENLIYLAGQMPEETQILKAPFQYERVSQIKEQFQKLLIETKRPGIEDFLKWLDKTDFYTAPASTKFHGSEKFGLLKHSLGVYHHMTAIAETYKHDIKSDSITISSLLHDVCKVLFYKDDTRNVKENGVWKTVPYISIDDKIPLGHGEKSVILIQHHMRLNINEIMAIRWHMGGFDDGLGFMTRTALNNALHMFPIITLLHSADLADAFFGAWEIK